MVATLSLTIVIECRLEDGLDMRGGWRKKAWYTGKGRFVIVCVWLRDLAQKKSSENR